MSSLGSSPPAKRRRKRDRLDVGFDDDIDDGSAGTFGGNGAPGASGGSLIDAAVENDGGDETSRRDQTQVYANGLLLPLVDHAHVAYPALVKDCYCPLPRLAELVGAPARAVLAGAGVVVSGAAHALVHAPLQRFQDLALTLPKALLGTVLARYDAPTPVQQAVIPAALSGSDIISVAKTGSGKTVAFALPLLAHVVAQDRRNAGIAGAGPSALVLAPTRELALQIAQVLRSFASSVGLGVACVVGGTSKYEQFKQLRDGRNAVIVLTPGRFIDMVRMKACSLSSVSFVVLDEADRMVESMGFGPQVQTVLSQIRPDAQKVLTSATFPSSVGHLARNYLSVDHIRLEISRAAANAPGSRQDEKPNPEGSGLGSRSNRTAVAFVSENVTEQYVSVGSEGGRLTWLVDHLPGILDEGLAIVFCSTRGGTAALANELRVRGFAVGCIHGETDMADRASLMRMFRSKELSLIVATDVAARGLDVDGVRTVVNFEPAKSYEDHVHRSGRTGRAGASGTAVTLLVPGASRDSVFVGAAVSALRAINAPIPSTLLAMFDQSGTKQRRGRARSRDRSRVDGSQGGRGGRRGLRG